MGYVDNVLHSSLGKKHLQKAYGVDGVLGTVNR
jgi:hypothetical protein